MNCGVFPLRAANSLGEFHQGGIHHLINCLLSARQYVRSSSRGGGHLMNETDRIPGFRELAGS